MSLLFLFPRAKKCELTNQKKRKKIATFTTKPQNPRITKSF
jgi:hypothetical protein